MYDYGYSIALDVKENRKKKSCRAKAWWREMIVMSCFYLNSNLIKDIYETGASRTKSGNRM